MKTIILLLLFTYQCNAQQNAWVSCYDAASYYFEKGDKETLLKKRIGLCYNSSAFAIIKNDEQQVFIISNYQKSSKDGHLLETFINAAGDADMEGDYFVMIEHSNPVRISISYTRLGGYGYLFNSKDDVTIKERYKAKTKNVQR